MAIVGHFPNVRCLNLCALLGISIVHKKLETSLYLMVRYGMERFWNPLSVNWDMHGLKYISTIEVRYAFFSSQKETKSNTGQP